MAVINFKSPYLKSLDLDVSEAGTAQALISAVQSGVEKYCNRKFELQEYDKTFVVKQDGSIVLDNYPVSAIYRIAFSSGSNLILSSSSPVANYSITTSGVILRSFDNGAWVNHNLLYSAYPTMQSLVNGITGNWTAILQSGFELYPSSDLVEGQFGSCGNGQEVTISYWMDYTGNYQFHPTTGIIDGIYNGWGYGNGTSEQWNEFTYYQGFGASMFGTYGGYFSRGKNCRVVYQGGFNPVPEEIKMLIGNLVVSAYNGPEGRISQETIGQYSYTLMNPDQLPLSDRKILALYKDYRI